MRMLDSGLTQWPRGRPALLALLLSAVAAEGCQQAKDAPPADAYRRLERDELNRRAARADLPVFWIDDFNQDGALDARELAVLWPSDSDRSKWQTGGKLTSAFAQAYADLLSATGPATEGRRALVAQELAQGVPVLIFTDLSHAPAEDQAFVTKVAEVARAVERVHMRQLGSLALLGRVEGLDPLSRALFRRNQAPWCMAPATEGKPECGAFADTPPRVSGLYPADLQQQDGFCETLAGREDAEQLLQRAHVVARRDGELVAVPYSEAFAPEMQAVAAGLTELADLVPGERDAPLRAYIQAAAAAFTTNDWSRADEAFVRMNSASARWYLRVAPDEVYFSPCGRKGMMHLSLGMVDGRSRTWKRKLALVKSKMEEKLAELAGPPYKARNVDFTVPDFVNIVLNAGDARRPSGAYIGQSLPNAGPVARAGRQRTLAFSNLYSDPDSQRQLARTMRTYFCKESVGRMSTAPRPRIISTVLHDASKNLGPTAEHRVNGRTPDQIFGTLMANTLEELKAQSASMYFIDWLRQKELVEPQVAEEVLSFNLIWAFTHISRGVFTPGGQRRLHGHVGAIELGSLLESEAVVWRPDATAANGEDEGCFAMQFDRYPQAVRALASTVARIKSRGDRAGAEALQARFVDRGPQPLFEVIQERGRRQPTASFVYAFRTGEQK